MMSPPTVDGWTGFRRASTLILAGVLAMTGIAFTDHEAIVLGVVALLAAEGGRLGSTARTVGLGVSALLALDVIGWSAPALVVGVRDGTTVAGLMASAVLVVAALAVLVTMVGPAARWAEPDVSVAVGALATTVGLLAIASAALGSSGAGSHPGDVVVTISRSSYSRDEIAIAAGQQSFHLSNDDLFWHTFTIDGVGVDEWLPVASRRRVTVWLDPGTYTYFCAIPGHRALGMEGRLLVTATPTGSPTASSPSA